MAKKKSTSFKTKSKKNKKSKKPKSKKNKGEKEKEAKKIGMGLKDICSALTDLQVDANSAKILPIISSEKEKRPKEKFDKSEKSISRLFQKLSCDNDCQKKERKTRSWGKSFHSKWKRRINVIHHF